MPQVLGYVVIGAGGDVRQSSGVTKPPQNVEAGVWEIYFDFSVANACEVASIAGPEAPGWITAYGAPAHGDNAVTACMGVFEAGVPVKANMTFQLLVVS